MADDELVSRRRLGQTNLTVKPGQVGTSNAAKPEHLGKFEYAHLRAPLPDDLKGSEIFSPKPTTAAKAQQQQQQQPTPAKGGAGGAAQTTPEAYFLMVRDHARRHMRIAMEKAGGVKWLMWTGCDVAETE